MQNTPILSKNFSNCRFAFALLVAAAVALSGCGQRDAAPTSQQAPSEVAVSTSDRGPVKIVTPAAEFELLPSGYIRASLLKDGQKLTLDDPELHTFPIAYMSEPGFWTLSDKEAEGLRAYLHKGGFVIFDDFRGWDLDNFQAQIRRALPESRLVELDATHPIFHSFFEINSLEFVQYYDRGKPVFYGIFEDNDPKKRLMVIANYNNDLGEYWEFSDTGFVSIDLSNEAYKYAVNYMIYAMTH